MKYPRFLFLLILLGLMSSADPTWSKDSALNVLIFSRSEGGINPVASPGIAAFKGIATDRRWLVTGTDDPKSFTDRGLKRYDVVVWLNTSGDVLSPRQQSAYERFHRSGKGTVAIHRGGLDTERYGWSWYRKLASTTMRTPMAFEEVTVINGGATHPATYMLPWLARNAGEWYQYDSPPSEVHPLLFAYDSAFDPELLHPITWYRNFDGGRYFYTGLGSRVEDYAPGSPLLSHLAGGIEWAGGKVGDEVVKNSGGEALILKEFDGHTPNGIWERQVPSPDFKYEVKANWLVMQDSSSLSLHNRHLVRRGVAIDPQRPYAIEGKFMFPEPVRPSMRNLHSFCVNLNVAGEDGDLRRINTWSVNIQLANGGKSQTRFMGFRDGGFTQFGELENNWGEAGIEYSFRIHVNADLRGLPQHKLVSMVVKKGEETLGKFQVDYSPFPYQPDYTKKVRFGLNGHGLSWVLKDLKIYYLDVLASSQ